MHITRTTLSGRDAVHPAAHALARPGADRDHAGNLDLLIREVTKLYGNKRIWITEYGYQTTRPIPSSASRSPAGAVPDTGLRIARRHPRIDMMLWFLLRTRRAPDRELAVAC